MDSGKVTVKIPADLMSLEAASAVADKMGIALQRARLGNVVSCSELSHEPFARDSPEFGRRWHEIVLHLDTSLPFRRLADFLVACGAPFSSHITYTDHMRLCGESLGRA